MECSQTAEFLIFLSVWFSTFFAHLAHKEEFELNASFDTSYSAVVQSKHFFILID